MADLDDNAATGGLNETARSMKEAAGDTGADLSEKAGALAADAKDAALEKAEGAKQGLGEGLKTLGGALRAASDHLSENGQAGTSKLVGEAASGLEHFAGSLENKPLGEVFEDLRNFGRDNKSGLFAGSMLAGLALGRMLRASDTEGGANRSSGATSQSFGEAGAAPPASGLPDAGENQESQDASPAPRVTASSGLAS